MINFRPVACGSVCAFYLLGFSLTNFAESFLRRSLLPSLTLLRNAFLSYSYQLPESTSIHLQQQGRRVSIVYLLKDFIHTYLRHAVLKTVILNLHDSGIVVTFSDISVLSGAAFETFHETRNTTT
jgi:hypothetical protein